MNRLIPIAICNYGSYGNSTGPFFSPITLVYTIDDGLLVVPHVKSEIEATQHKAGQNELLKIYKTEYKFKNKVELIPQYINKTGYQHNIKKQFRASVFRGGINIYFLIFVLLQTRCLNPTIR